MRQIITIITRQKRRPLNCAAATGVADTRIDNSAPANGEDILNTRGPSRTGAIAAECPKRKAPGVAIPIEVKNRRSSDRVAQTPPKPFEGTIRFLPRQNVFENVVAQIKSGSVAYSLFVLARLFLEKAGRYEVRLTAKAEAPLFQLGEDGGISVDREFLERNAFRFAQRDFYQVNVVESDPIKGNFSNVARCRLSGTLLGPTNHHAYQPQLRSLYEQRFSRRMSFPDYQRQIEIVSDPAVVERWKEEARKITTYTTVREETPLTFSSAAETERHFRSHYFPALVRSVTDVTVGGTSSRSLPDRILNRAIEAGVGPRNPLSFKRNAGACEPIPAKRPAHFSSSAWHVVCFANSHPRVCS